MKIAIVGAGIFGVTAAIKLAQNGHNVKLFEKNNDILKAASGINQYRLHRGYHYPRSIDTALSCIKAEPSFRSEYREAVIDGVDHYYCISKEHSLTSADEYIDFCKKYGLEFSASPTSIVRDSSIDLCVKVKESLFDPIKLYNICSKRLKSSNIDIALNTTADQNSLEGYDFIVVCAYSNMNSLLKAFQAFQKDYQYELCEKPVVKLPKSFSNKSIVILDGPFMCVDPYGTTGLHVVGNVVHAIHQTNIGKYPIVEGKYMPLINNGIIKNPTITNFNKFIKSSEKFMPEIVKAEHVGSMFTIRTVMPYQDSTDSRPTVVDRINGNILTVFSGKIVDCVETAEEVARMIG